MKWKDLYKIGITGSRRFPNCDTVTEWLTKYIDVNYERDKVVLVTGGSIGVDNAVEVFCIRQGIKNLVIPAMWLAFDRSAAAIRNQYIVDLSNEMLAFWDGSSPGTKMTIDMAKKTNKSLQVLSLKDLQKDLGYRPTYIKLPPRIKVRDAHNVRRLVANAQLDKLFGKGTGKKKKVKRNVI